MAVVTQWVNCAAVENPNSSQTCWQRRQSIAVFRIIGGEDPLDPPHRAPDAPLPLFGRKIKPFHNSGNRPGINRMGALGAARERLRNDAAAPGRDGSGAPKMCEFGRFSAPRSY